MKHDDQQNINFGFRRIMTFLHGQECHDSEKAKHDIFDQLNYLSQIYLNIRFLQQHQKEIGIRKTMIYNHGQESTDTTQTNEKIMRL